MRCPNCAAEILDRSRFCGICGRRTNESHTPPSVAVRPVSAESLSPSLFELPVSPGARLTKVLVVLALDLVLVVAGVAMIVSYFGARADATRVPSNRVDEVDSGVNDVEVEVLAPEQVGSTDGGSEAKRKVLGQSGQTKQKRTATRAPRGKGAGRRRKATLPPLDDHNLDRDAAPATDRVGSGGAADSNGADDAEGANGADGVNDAEGVKINDAAEIAARDARIGALTRRVALVVNKNRGQFQRCYRQVAKSSGPVQGKVVIRFQVMANGSATSVSTSANETGSERLASCLVAQFASWRFPTHTETDAVPFLWPIVFKSPNSSGAN